MPPDDFLGRELKRALDDLAPRFEELFRRYGVGPEAAVTLVDQAVLEVQLRCKHPSEVEPRLLRAVERGCQAEMARKRRDALAALDGAAEDDDDAPDPAGEPAS